MSGIEAVPHDDQSHYEISLTAGQAFLAFVLLLLSLAASFAFGLIVGRGQVDERLVVRKEPSVVTEASVLPKKSDGRIVELGVAEEDFKAPAIAPAVPDAPAAAPEPAAAAPASPPAVVEEAAPAPAPAPVAAPPAQPAYAQLLSTSDQKTAETLAAKLIEHGFTAAYVERGSNEKGPLFRVRVKFASEADARAAETRLKEFAKDVWIVK
ncbi:MAG TPA: SPOR domain-containing protein [Thermoanaerobaculia bacterium]|nr:SPOR domain-containing protein [Thermoanaerobaculia bacterium]